MTKANTASPKKSLEIPSVTHRFFVALQRAYAKIFKIQKNLCAFFDQTASDKACAHDKRTKREKERPERATSSQPRATPWVSVYKPLRPVRAKVWANGWLLLLPLQGVGNGGHGTQGVALGWGLVGLSARAGPQIGLPRTIFIDLIFQF